ncbi:MULTISPECIES: hypothetical protein [unclassified Bradyrhizobium]|uniref:hypothetical protein n=1 Tax=unclassified Bradyrhizobium TaxID=2631580 RepID=UPI0024B249F6|nr:hypothetical protein [Bradyrhizobium sp. CB2312]WFU70612.1 hypothetical protein QA642_35910 [Bradyrhizobium sp. CB2312]
MVLDKRPTPQISGLQAAETIPQFDFHYKYKHWHPILLQAEDSAMRDLRDAKTMAQTLRASLTEKGLKTSI